MDVLCRRFCFQRSSFKGRSQHRDGEAADGSEVPRRAQDAAFLNSSVDLVSDMEDETPKMDTSTQIQEGIKAMLAGLENVKVRQEDEAPKEADDEQVAKKPKVADAGGFGSGTLQAFGRPSK